jgi:hypothetical protein
LIGKEIFKLKKRNLPDKKGICFQVMFAFRGQEKINLKILFKNTFKIATFLLFENFFTNGVIAINI